MEVTKIMRRYRKTNNKYLRGIYRKLTKLWGCCVGKNMVLGENVQFVHNSIGSVIYTDTVIGNNVRIYQNVTIGKADVVSPCTAKIIVHDNAILCAGAKILCKANETLEIGENSIIAANAVLLNSIPANEIWGGVPAKKLKDNKRMIGDERI